MARFFITAAIGGFTWFLISPCGMGQEPPPASSALHARRLPSQAGVVPPADLRVDSALVLVPVHVTSPLGATVTNLSADTFRIYEDGVEQRIASFSRDYEPVSVGLVFDASGSMDNKMRQSAAAAAAFFKTANSGDEFFLVEFGERPRLAVSFTSDSDQIYKKIAGTRPFGRTSLIDALHMAVSQMKNAQNARKAIVILSDGGDNHSRLTFSEIRNTLLESDVQIYAMGLFDQTGVRKHTPEEQNGPDLLKELAEQTGGRVYPVDNFDNLTTISATIGNDLRDQYLLGYNPLNATRDGKYRQLKLNLTPPSGMRDLRIYYRRGYYAPTN